MHSKINVLLVILFMTIGLSSCNPSIPKEDPDLGIDIDMSQLNTTLQVDTPKKNKYLQNWVVCQELCKISGGLVPVAGTAMFLKWRLRTTA